MSRLNEALSAIARTAPRTPVRPQPLALLLPAPRAARRPVVPVLCAVAILGVTGTAARWWLADTPAGQPTVLLPPVAVAAPVPEVPARVAPSGSALRSQARQAIMLGALDEASDLLEQALRMGGDDAATLNDLGVILIRRGEHGRGVQALERSLRLDPRRADTHRNLAVALEDNGDGRRAITHYRTFLALAPAHADRAQVERRLASLEPGRSVRD